MQSISVDELQDFVRDRPQALLLDVREPWEVQLARFELPGAATLQVPMNELPRRLDAIARSQPIVCICHHGVRSAQVVAFLQRQGYPQVYNLAGGVDAWSARVDPAMPRY